MGELEAAFKEVEGEAHLRSGTAQPIDNSSGLSSSIDSPASTPLPPEITNSIGMNLKLIPAGAFMMGSSPSEAGREVDESPRHKVQISTSFYMASTEVTQSQWFQMMHTKPWSGMRGVKENDNCPAVYVSWQDAISFCEKLSSAEVRTYRLPTEAEWEYACRAGSDAAYCFGNGDRLQDFAWYSSVKIPVSSQLTAQPVGLLRSNDFGLFDMHGNVYEWCHDWHAPYQRSQNLDPTGPAIGKERVFRGGCYLYSGADCRSANRGLFVPTLRNSDVGFRVITSSPAIEAK